MDNIATLDGKEENDDRGEYSENRPSCGQLPFEIMFHIVGYAAYHIENLVQLSRTCHFMNNLIMVEAHLYRSLLDHQELRQMLQKDVEERLAIEIEKNDGHVYEFSKIKSQYRYNAHSFLTMCFKTQFPVLYRYLRYFEPHYRNLIDYVSNKQWLIFFHRFYSVQKIIATVNELKGNASRITETESQKRCRYQLLKGISLYGPRPTNSTNPLHFTNAVSLPSFESDNNCSCQYFSSKKPPYSIHLASFGFGDNGPPVDNLLGSLTHEDFYFSVSKDEYVSVSFNVTRMPFSHGVIFFCAYLTAQVFNDIVTRSWQIPLGVPIMILSETKFDENRVKSRINELLDQSINNTCPERLVLMFKISEIDRDWIREHMKPSDTKHERVSNGLHDPNQTDYCVEDFEPELSAKIRTGEQLLNENATEFASLVALVHMNNQRPTLEPGLPPNLRRNKKHQTRKLTNRMCTIH